MAHSFDANLGTNGANGTSATTITLTTAAAAAAGAEIFVVVIHWDATERTVTVTDSDSNTYEQVGYQRSQGNERIALFRCRDAGGLAASSTITATFSAATTYRRIAAMSFTGGASSGSARELLVGFAGGGGSGSTAVNSADVDTLVNALILRACSADGGATMTWGAGTEVHDYADGTIGGLKTSYSVGQAAGTYDAAGTLSTTQVHADIVAAIAESAPSAPYVASTGTLAAVTSGSLTVTLPSHQADDILVCSVLVWVPNTASAINDIPDLSGWTKVGHVKNADGASCLFWKRAASGAESNPVFTRGSGWDTGTDGIYAGRAYVIRGCVTSGDPYDEVDVSAMHTTANQSCNALTVSGSGRLAVQFLAQSDDYTGEPYMDGWSETSAVETTTGTDASFRAFWQRGVSSDTSADASVVAAPAAGFYTFTGMSFKPPATAATSLVASRNRAAHAGLTMRGRR